MSTEEAAEFTMMDDLAAAWDAAEANEEPTDDSSETEQPELAAEEVAADDTIGRSEVDADTTNDDIGVSGDTPEAGSETSGESDKPPVGLSPAAREAWKDAPKAIKDEVTKREKEFAVGMQKNAEQANRAAQMDKSLQPYQQLFAMNGGIGNTLPGLLTTASQLQMGSAPQKAQAVANLIKQFGVDINTLDSMLVGEAPPPEQQTAQNIQQLVDQRFAQQDQVRQHHQQEQTRNQVHTEIQTFSNDPKHEFYNDVKMDMANMMDMAHARGQHMGLEESYNLAVTTHPQISQIINSRNSQQTVEKKRQAATSISGTRGGPGGGGSAPTTRSALEDAWDNAGQL